MTEINEILRNILSDRECVFQTIRIYGGGEGGYTRIACLFSSIQNQCMISGYTLDFTVMMEDYNKI